MLAGGWGFNLGAANKATKASSFPGLPGNFGTLQGEEAEVFFDKGHVQAAFWRRVVSTRMTAAANRRLLRWSSAKRQVAWQTTR